MFKILLLLMFAAQAQVQALEIGGEQNIIARKRVLLAYTLTDASIYSCLVQSQECGLTSQEATKLQEIFNVMVMPESQNLIRFKSDPDLFDVGSGSHRLAVTGRQVTSEIFLNADLVDVEGARLKLDRFISIFVHEFGHHTGLADTEDHFLDQLGNKVARLYARTTQTLEHPMQPIQFLVYNSLASPQAISDWNNKDLGTWPRIFVTDGARILSLGYNYPFLLNCAYGTSVRHAWLNDLHWTADGRLAGKGLHYCLASGFKLAVNESYFADLELQAGKFMLGLEPAQQMIATPLFELTSDRSFENTLAQQKPTVLLQATQSKAAPEKLVQGGVWKISMEVRGDLSKYSSCSLLVSSDDLELSYATGQIQARETYRDCKMTAAGSGNFKVEALFEFSPETVKRTYFVKAFKLLPKDLVNGSPAAVLPSTRLSVEVGERHATVSRISEFALTSEGSTVLSPALGFVKNGLCRKFEFKFDLPSNSALAQAHVTYTMYYRNPLISPITLTDRITFNAWHDWKLESIAKSDGGMTHKFTLSLFPEFMVPEGIERIDIREVNAMTESFEEYRADFIPKQFGLDAYLRIGMPCE